MRIFFAVNHKGDLGYGRINAKTVIEQRHARLLCR
ncbi:Uncharacterised protein [Vibrio cholerae]|nr:Uncharacterised protein [Vibrio cholerae]CSI35522.1 Uncharacterised protein [Vibrio cholerae]CSI59426.1 Uncharacterised protein [Vibrio cholerae]